MNRFQDSFMQVHLLIVNMSEHFLAIAFLEEMSIEILLLQNLATDNLYAHETMSHSIHL